MTEKHGQPGAGRRDTRQGGADMSLNSAQLAALVERASSRKARREAG
jgi:hypothetical protein